MCVAFHGGHSNHLSAPLEDKGVVASERTNEGGMVANQAIDNQIFIKFCAILVPLTVFLPITIRRTASDDGRMQFLQLSAVQRVVKYR